MRRIGSSTGRFGWNVDKGKEIYALSITAYFIAVCVPVGAGRSHTQNVATATELPHIRIQPR